MQSDFFILCNEYGIGHSVDIENDNIPVDYYGPSADIERVKELGLCNGFRIWIDPDEEKLSRAQKGGYGMMIDFWIMEGRMELFAKKKGLGLKKYIDKTIDLMMDYMKKYGNKVWWNIWPEADNPGNVSYWPKEFATRKASYEFLKDHLATDKYCKNRTQKDVSQYDPYVGFKKPAFQYLKERGIKPEDLNISALTCGVSTCHHFFDWGASLVQQEANVGFSNVQVSIAFLRGAAHQYNGSWGLDFAPWKAPTIYPAIYDEEGRRLGGVSESLLLREWLAAFISGANYIGEQLSDVIHWVKDKAGNKSLSPLGRAAKDFADFALKRYPNRGKTYVPAALMLEKYHGWDCPRPFMQGTCMGRMPYEKKDEMIQSFFSYAFPDYENRDRYYTQKWAPKGSFKNQSPWMSAEVKTNRDRMIAFREKLKEGLDTRPYEKGELVDSTWGDSFDVVLENAPVEVLKQYPALILLGEVKLSNDLRKTIKQYVETGGKLMLGITQVEKGDEELIGVELTGEKLESSQSLCFTCGRRYNEDAYDYQLVKPVNATILARTEYDRKTGADGDPLITKNSVGKGEVFFCSVPFGIGKNQKTHAGLLEIMKDTLDHFLSPLMLVEIEGEEIEYIVNLTDYGKMVTLINNSEKEWNGKIRVKDVNRWDTVRDLWNDKFILEYAFENKAITIRLNIAPWEFGILGIGKF